MNDLLKWLENWYAEKCNGDWEHLEGIRIGTLDNPGWYVKINLEELDLPNSPLDDVDREIDSDDWVVCRVRDNAFEGFGGLYNLETILGIFRAWWEEG